MRTPLAIVLLAVGLLAGVGSARAADPLPARAEELAASVPSLVIGRIMKIEAQSLLVQEDRGGPVHVRVTAETLTPPNLKVGDEVIVSLLANGVAMIITSGRTQAEASVLGEGDQDGR